MDRSFSMKIEAIGCFSKVERAELGGVPGLIQTKRPRLETLPHPRFALALKDYDQDRLALESRRT